jgi:hypothetical protein
MWRPMKVALDTRHEVITKVSFHFFDFYPEQVERYALTDIKKPRSLSF